MLLDGGSMKPSKIGEISFEASFFIQVTSWVNINKPIALRIQ
jgi:hypothetical protein